MIKKFLAIAALILTPLSASAGGLSNPIIPVADPVPVASSTSVSTGDLDFYVGASIGQSAVDTQFDLEYKGDIEEVSLDLDGTTASVFAGARYEFESNLFVGAEFEFTNLGVTDTVDCHGTCQVCTTDVDHLADIVITAGYTFDRVTVYGAAGVASIAGTYALENPNGSEVGSGEYTAKGTVVGLGAEFAISEAFSIGVEANQYSFDSTNIDAGRAYTMENGIDLNVVSVRASFHF